MTFTKRHFLFFPLFVLVANLQASTASYSTALAWSNALTANGDAVPQNRPAQPAILATPGRHAPGDC